MNYTDNLKNLSKNEFTVLKMKCGGKKYEEIASDLGYSLEWVQLQMSNVYIKLGFEKKMHWTQRTKILTNEVCPELPEEWSPVKEEIKEPDLDREMMAIVLRDETELLKQEEDVIKGEVIEPRPRRRALVSVSITAVLCLVIGGVLVYWWINRPDTPLIPANTPLSPTLDLSDVLGSTEESLPTPLPTKIPANTAEIPTLPAKDYYGELEAVIIEPDVYMQLTDRFSQVGGFCGNINADWGVAIYIKNGSDGQFALRFNTGAFSAVDNVGTRYELLGSELNNTTQTKGIDRTYQLNATRDTYICLSFIGEIPLSANYIDIIADWISGVGPTVFRKDI